MLEYTAIGHVAFWVKDLDRSLDFYCNKLGMRKAFDFKNDKGDIWIQYLEAAPLQFIELFPASREVDGRAPAQSFNHVSLQVEDLQKTMDLLRENGVLCYDGPDGLATKDAPLTVPPVACCHSKCAWVDDPDGNYIEFMELTEKSVHHHFKDND